MLVMGRAQREYMLPRTVVRQVECPKCGAAPGKLCLGARGKGRESNHMERVELAERFQR